MAVAGKMNENKKELNVKSRTEVSREITQPKGEKRKGNHSLKARKKGKSHSEIDNRGEQATTHEWERGGEKKNPSQESNAGPVPKWEYGALKHKSIFPFSACFHYCI
jgi:hypothetical protein